MRAPTEVGPGAGCRCECLVSRVEGFSAYLGFLDSCKWSSRRVKHIIYKGIIL